MKYKFYATKQVDKDILFPAIVAAKEYLSGLPVEFSEVEFIKDKESKSSLYDVVMSWARMVLRPIKSIKTDFVKSLPHDGYDGVILAVDKGDAKESSGLYGQHHRVDGKCYIEVYISDKHISSKKGANGKYVEVFSSNKLLPRTAASNAIIHEVFHSLSAAHEIPDYLHTFIEENNFDNYKDYLLNQIKDKTEVFSDGFILYSTALNFVNLDPTPRDLTPDIVACAEVVNAIHTSAFGKPIGGLSSTYNMYRALLIHPDFIRVDNPMPGDVIISPTGYSRFGSNTPIKNGHVGIVGKEGRIMSNDSPTGLFKEGYTIESWIKRYGTTGGYPVAYFRRK